MYSEDILGSNESIVYYLNNSCSYALLYTFLLLVITNVDYDDKVQCIHTTGTFTYYPNCPDTSHLSLSTTLFINTLYGKCLSDIIADK